MCGLKKTLSFLSNGLFDAGGSISKTSKPGSYRGRVNNEPENNRKTLMDLKMLKDKDRIFQNLYNDMGSDVNSSQKRSG